MDSARGRKCVRLCAQSGWTPLKLSDENFPPVFIPARFSFWKFRQPFRFFDRVRRAVHCYQGSNCVLQENPTPAGIRALWQAAEFFAIQLFVNYSTMSTNSIGDALLGPSSQFGAIDYGASLNANYQF